MNRISEIQELGLGRIPDFQLISDQRRISGKLQDIRPDNRISGPTLPRMKEPNREQSFRQNEQQADRHVNIIE